MDDFHYSPNNGGGGGGGVWNNWGGWNLWLELIIGGVGIIGGLEPFVIFNSAVTKIHFSIFSTNTSENFLKINNRNNIGITLSGVENFQQINYRG